MINIGIHGSKGRMGIQIDLCLKDQMDVKASAFFDQGSDYEAFFKKSDVIIDFSTPQGCENLISYARSNPKPLVIGTTGLNSKQYELLQSASITMPILYATNMSLGIAVLKKLSFLASEILRDFDIEIVEMHHNKKKDAPSGTAMTLGEYVAKARNLNLDQVRISGRDGLIGARSKDEIAIMSLRGGDIVGSHRVGFYNEGEFIELNHTATSRATFAMGAIRCAKWIVAQDNGLYDINDCLGL
ncbi:4-hydroxy-tetrahydrodipicolinate reductase [Campylobacter insulaenigrae]|uniref:4-hydroxy-tetrahydrodipicolinate reductase n=2 Tax=Campylobacter insulaenigrae TaxID=260714 RepID=A0A0A8H3Q8_9BACT|nr:4-hydroxy-tetrahydrodipicolinate reductase [Campylobacter insulaenigrae]AJC88310.1 4-hydroxy-tetrahydrodipicolinate reductase [Campylobacter insulaenigrae NCTC 12927]MCR6570980.1 4-hydroxy-tetrahydrodipicolinate reductase [Campylobacter insulaenigrae]MCR6572600.1 4-hydroxy-tetrahydrodipicolinate reductase [Campylobacter insulaenigrae]MCR6573914.1 4-hydroxy-tetrahydrodipicolinate reductase [Campylobacter insulaenigrae]MCR6575692.1 4-hydroxy-tetrahydrodipicolinate reductase [Campylobacter ins